MKVKPSAFKRVACFSSSYEIRESIVDSPMPMDIDCIVYFGDGSEVGEAVEACIRVTALRPNVKSI